KVAAGEPARLRAQARAGEGLMDCKILGERLVAYLDGELGAEEAQGLQAHARACPACAARVHGEEAFAAFLRRRLRSPEPAPVELRNRIVSALAAGEGRPGERRPWRLGEVLASPWLPRVAIAAVLVLLVLVPLVG